MYALLPTVFTNTANKTAPSSAASKAGVPLKHMPAVTPAAKPAGVIIIIIIMFFFEANTIAYGMHSSRPQKIGLHIIPRNIMRSSPAAKSRPRPWLVAAVLACCALLAVIAAVVATRRARRARTRQEQFNDASGGAPPRTMRCVVVTPAGRREYLALLHAHLLRQRAHFDEWHLWLNTQVQEDIDFMRQLERDHAPWIKVVTDPESDPKAGNMNIHRFFKYATDDRTVYIRLDDDVVYLEDDFIRKLYAERLRNRDYFLVYANIINNAVISHMHQRSGTFAYPDLLEPTCMGNAWSNPAIAEELHRQFLADARAGNVRRWHRSFAQFETTQRVSINAIAFFGSVFKRIQVGADEEDWLSVAHPREAGLKNLVVPSAICAHYAFHTQRAHLDKTDILEQYRRLAARTQNGTSPKQRQKMSV